MRQHNKGGKCRESKVELLACSMECHVRSTGDYVTAFPPLLLHRRDAPTESISCVYGLGLAVTTQGGKQVMLGEKVLNYGPGYSMLTTIDSPMTAKITRATKREP